MTHNNKKQTKCPLGGDWSNICTIYENFIFVKIIHIERVFRKHGSGSSSWSFNTSVTVSGCPVRGKERKPLSFHSPLPSESTTLRVLLESTREYYQLFPSPNVLHPFLGDEVYSSLVYQLVGSPVWSFLTGPGRESSARKIAVTAGKVGPA